jgi:hypothetical protein
VIVLWVGWRPLVTTPRAAAITAPPVAIVALLASVDTTVAAFTDTTRHKAYVERVIPRTVVLPMPNSNPVSAFFEIGLDGAVKAAARVIVAVNLSAVCSQQVAEGVGAAPSRDIIGTGCFGAEDEKVLVAAAVECSRIASSNVFPAETP